MRFPRSVEAARGIGMEKKALAEALYTEIPPSGSGRRPAGEVTDAELFEQAADEIEAETGERYAGVTLMRYRNVAAWVVGGRTSGSGLFPWAVASWTAHREAFEKGESFNQFARDPATKRQVRARNGHASGDVPAASRAINRDHAEAEKLVAGLDDEGLEAVTEAAFHRAVERATGQPQQPRRQPTDPRPQWLVLANRVELDLSLIRNQVRALRAGGDHQQADMALAKIRGVLAEAMAEMEEIPDTIEGIGQ